jgi:hypothetical protein
MKKIVLISFKKGMLLDSDIDVEIPVRTASRTGVTSAPGAQPVTIRHTLGYVYLDICGSFFAPFPFAAQAGIFNGDSRATACRAGASNADKPLIGCNLTNASAG